MVARAVSTSHAPLASTRMDALRADGGADCGHPVDVARVAHLHLDRGVPGGQGRGLVRPDRGDDGVDRDRVPAAGGHVPQAASSAAARARAGSHG